MSISFNTIAPDTRVPLFFAEMDNGRANLFTQKNRALIVGRTQAMQMPASPVLITTVDQARTLCGATSPLFQSIAAFRAANPQAELWALKGAETTGTRAKATLSLDKKFTAAVYRVSLGEAPGEVVADSSEDEAAILARIAARLTAGGYTASVKDKTLTVEASFTGAEYNGLVLVITATSNDMATRGEKAEWRASLSGGTGSCTLPATGIGDMEFDFIILPNADAASMASAGKLLNDTSGRWSPSQGLYGHAWFAAKGTVGTLVQLTSTVNDQHLTVAGFEPDNPHPVWVLSAAYAAASALSLAVDPARPTQTMPLEGVTPAPPVSRFTHQERQIMLTSGVASARFEAGKVRVERGVTTYLKNKYGVADVSYLDSETLYTSAFFLRYVRSVITSRFGQHKLAENGTHIGAGQFIVTPQIMRDAIFAIYDELEEMGILENGKAMRAHTRVERNKNDPNRLDLVLAPDYVNQLRTVAVRNEFRLQSQG